MLALALTVEFLIPWRRFPRFDWKHGAIAVLIALQGMILTSWLFGFAGIAGGFPTWNVNSGIFDYVGLPYWLMAVISFLLIDIFFYFRHRLMHRVPFFWRVHRTHHLDERIDVSTSVRFHPFEAVSVQGSDLLFVVLIGAPIEIYAVHLTAQMILGVIQHANIKWPDRLDSLASKMIATPTIHRLHHANADHLINSNYGTLLSVWDAMFGTRQYDAAVSRDCDFGLKNRGGTPDDSLGGLLLDPFRRV